MPRAKLSKLKADLSDLHNLEMSPAPGSNWLVFRNDAGEILFSVKADNLCDANGNWFENDLP